MNKLVVITDNWDCPHFIDGYQKVDVKLPRFACKLFQSECNSEKCPLPDAEDEKATRWIYKYLRADREEIDMGPYDTEYQARVAMKLHAGCGALTEGPIEVDGDYELKHAWQEKDALKSQIDEFIYDENHGEKLHFPEER